MSRVRGEALRRRHRGCNATSALALRISLSQSLIVAAENFSGNEATVPEATQTAVQYYFCRMPLCTLPCTWWLAFVLVLVLRFCRVRSAGWELLRFRCDLPPRPAYLLSPNGFDARTFPECSRCSGCPGRVPDSRVTRLRRSGPHSGMGSGRASCNSINTNHFGEATLERTSREPPPHPPPHALQYTGMRVRRDVSQ